MDTLLIILTLARGRVRDPGDPSSMAAAFSTVVLTQQAVKWMGW